MAATESALPTLSDFLAAPLRVGDPDVHGPLAVFPLFGPRAGDWSTSRSPRASRRGLLVKELEGGASVNDLVVLNPTDAPVLLYEGEEVLGAQQNRTFDVSVLVAAGERLRVPVSCVEHGRWDGSRHGEAFRPAPQAAYPSLRRMKNVAAHARVAAGMEARAEQGAVWDEVAAKSSRLGRRSPTGAMHDIYEQRRDRLRDVRPAIPLHPGQTGALVAIGGASASWTTSAAPTRSRPSTRPLVQGYALDAVEAEAAADAAPPAPSLEAATRVPGGRPDDARDPARRDRPRPRHALRDRARDRRRPRRGRRARPAHRVRRRGPDAGRPVRRTRIRRPSGRR